MSLFWGFPQSGWVSLNNKQTQKKMPSKTDTPSCRGACFCQNRLTFGSENPQNHQPPPQKKKKHMGSKFPPQRNESPEPWGPNFPNRQLGGFLNPPPPPPGCLPHAGLSGHQVGAVAALDAGVAIGLRELLGNLGIGCGNPPEPLLWVGLYTQLFSVPGKKGNPFLGLDHFSGEPPEKNGETGSH